MTCGFYKLKERINPDCPTCGSLAPELIGLYFDPGKTLEAYGNMLVRSGHRKDPDLEPMFTLVGPKAVTELEADVPLGKLGLQPHRIVYVTGYGDNMLRLTVDDMRAAAEDGRRVTDILRRNSIFPRTFVWKFSLAEEQGTMEATLEELSRYADLELKTITTRFSSLLEPFLIAIVGIVVGSLVLSVFLPIFKLHGMIL